MGALGSGRWLRDDRHRRVHEVEQLDVRQMRRDGWLEPGTLVRIASGRLPREYLIERESIIVSEGLDVQEIALRWRSCRLGGERPAFVCPYCPHAVYLLYRRQGRWSCRRCARLRYESQLMPPLLRDIERANRLRRRLDPHSCLMLPLPERPAGMHGHTYQRLVAQIVALESGLKSDVQAQGEAAREYLQAVVGGL